MTDIPGECSASAAAEFNVFPAHLSSVGHGSTARLRVRRARLSMTCFPRENGKKRPRSRDNRHF